MVRGEGGSKSGNAIRSADLIVLLIVLVATGYLLWRRAEPNTTDLLSAILLAKACLAAVGITAAAGLWRTSRSASRRSRGWIRIPLYLTALVLAGMVYTRVALVRAQHAGRGLAASAGKIGSRGSR